MDQYMNNEASSISRPDVVVVENVSKQFVIRKDNSLKEKAVTLGVRGRAHAQAFEALDDISLTIPAGTTLGLMGPNGSGKSTLLKVIGGIIDPSSGTVRRRGRLAALLELGAGFHPDLSGRDNVFLNAAILGLTRSETEQRFDSIVAFAEVENFIDTQVKFYSSGMYVRLAFAVAVHTDPDILLVDEVLAVGDEAFQRKCLDKIRAFQEEGRTIVLVSHSVAQVREMCDSAVVLDHGRMIFSGDTGTAAKEMRKILESKRQDQVAKQESVEIEAESVVEKETEVASASVLSVELLDSDGRPESDFKSGDPMMIRITVDITTPMERWHTSFSIDTPLGQQVITSGTLFMRRYHGPVSPGRYAVSYQVAGLRVGGGQYFVNADIADASPERLDVKWQAANFFVPDSAASQGLLEADITKPIVVSLV